MLNVRISPKNAAIVKQAATIEPAPNCHGYTRAITATAAGHQYKIETLNGPRPLYVLTAHETPTSPNYIILVLEDYTAESIAIRDAQIFKNGSNYPARKESAPRYLKKYSQLAALVHGLITNGATAGPDAAALILAERAAERDKTPAEPATDTRPAEKAAEAPARPAEPAADMNPAKKPKSPTETRRTSEQNHNRRHRQRYRVAQSPTTPRSAGDRAKCPTAPANRHRIHKHTQRNKAPYRATQSRTRANAREPA